MKPQRAAGLRAWVGDFFDTLVLGLAVAAPSGGSEALDPGYADAMVLVFDEYFRRQSVGAHRQGPQR